MITTIIFDMNGVITDDEEIHELATQHIFNTIGFDVTPEIYRKFCLGRTDVAAFKDILEQFGVKDKNMEDLIEAKSVQYQQMIVGNLKTYPGVIKLIKDLHQKYPLALTSSSTFEEVQTVMDELQIGNLFEVLVTSQDVVYGKPHPEPYLLTAEKLNVAPASCLVIEDSENGVKSAKSAGMKCLAITNTENPDNLRLADWIIEDYAEITDDLIQKIGV
jgi:HAD superfamily hydrolase (TIGR01509 family)